MHSGLLYLHLALTCDLNLDQENTVIASHDLQVHKSRPSNLHNEIMMRSQLNKRKHILDRSDVIIQTMYSDTDPMLMQGVNGAKMLCQ